jgi:hypothetical protein
MTGEKIEHVARALCRVSAESYRADDVDGFVDRNWHPWVTHAVAAIEAMGSPEADAEQRVIREALSFDSCMAEFEGEMAACGEHLDGLFTACDALRKVRNAAVANP